MRFDARGAVLYLAADELRKILYRHIPSSADIDDISFADLVALCCKNVRADHIAHERIIARDGAIAEYRERLVVLTRQQKSADRERIWTARIEARPGNIEITERKRLDSKRK